MEPLLGHEPNKRGQHVHVVYENKDGTAGYNGHCGTTDDWMREWKLQLKRKYESGEGRKIWTNEPKRGLNSSHRFIELLVVCDKQFLNFHKGTDYHNYVLTIMNMVSKFLLNTYLIEAIHTEEAYGVMH